MRLEVGVEDEGDGDGFENAGDLAGEGPPHIGLNHLLAAVAGAKLSRDRLRRGDTEVGQHQQVFESSSRV